MAEDSAGKPSPAMARRCRPFLGTLVEIAAPAGHAGAIDAAFAAVAHIHARMSFHEETSDLAKLRRASPGTAVAVDAETIAVLRVARQLHARSEGLFDVAVGGRLVANRFLPRPPGIDLRRMTGTTADIVILDGERLLCHRPMLIDLGGIAKGHAVDRAIETLAAHGVPEAIVNAGGDLRVLGGTPHRIHLRNAAGAIDAALDIADGALASSSNVHLRHRARGRWTSPHRGQAGAPILAGHSVTVAAKRCIVADAMTKIALADPALAETMLAEWDGTLVRGSPARRMAA